MRTLSLLALLALLALPVLPAFAQEPTPWPARYTVAVETLQAGDFAEAAELLDALLVDAPSDVDRERTRALRDLAQLWATRGVVFVQKQDAGDDGLTAKAAGRRTTDELVLLYLTSVGYGLGTGAWFDVVADVQGSDIVWAPLLLAGASAGGVAALDNVGDGLKYGVPQSITSGLLIGLMEGVTWTAWNQARVRFDDEWSSETSASVVWGVTTAGAVGGGLVGHYVGTTPGRALWVQSTAMWSGLVLGMAAGSLGTDNPDDVGLLTGAVALNAGALAGILTAGDVSPRAARVRFIDLGGISGALISGGLYVALGGEDGQAALAITSAGTLTGLGSAWYFTRGMSKDETLPVAVTFAPTERGGALLTAVGTF